MEPGQKFDAFTVSHGNPHRLNPFTYTDEDGGWIFATDEEGDPFLFRKSEFTFKELEK